MWFNVRIYYYRKRSNEGDGNEKKGKKTKKDKAVQQTPMDLSEYV